MSTTPGTVSLLASSTDATLEAAVTRVRAAIGKRAPHIAVSFAALEGPHVGRMTAFMARAFQGDDVTRFTVEGEHGAMPADEARAIVARADVVFLSGGDPVRGARLLADAGADQWLREAHARGAHCMGVSAGAIMLCGWWAEWPDPLPDDEPHDGGTLVQCASVVPDLVVDCHAEGDDWGELKLVKAMVDARPAASPPGTRFVGLPTGSGLLLAPGHPPETLGTAPYWLSR